MVTFEDVSEIRMKKARQNHEIYRELWEKCSARITADAKRGKQQTHYVLSPFIPGKPLINVHRAARYVRDKLVHRGFEVSTDAQEPFVVVYVDWTCFKTKLKSRFVKFKKKEEKEDPATERLVHSRTQVDTPKDHTDITDEILALLAKT